MTELLKDILGQPAQFKKPWPIIKEINILKLKRQAML